MAPLFTLAQAHALLVARGVPVRAVGGEAAGATPIARVHSDTRSLRAGDLFAALRGERFDAHDFLPAAKAAGAVAALAERGLEAAALPGLEVPSVLEALQQLAAAWRARLHLPLVAVAGSNGKTTVTQMLGAIGRAAFGADGMLATQGNFNNHIGVPLTLLRLRQDDAQQHRAAVIETGMNHAGEMALLARLCAPTVGLVTNAQREHQEFMAGVEAVARENAAVIEALPASGTAVFPAADAFAPLWRSLAGARRVLTFGLEGEAGEAHDVADVRAHAEPFAGDPAGSADAPAWALVLHTPAGRAHTRLHAGGVHNVRNAAAAAAGALAAGLPLRAVEQGLEAFRPVPGRSRAFSIHHAGRRATLVDDSYNANPDSVLAAIHWLATLPAPRWLVLGDMGEVGGQGAAFHAEVGARAAAAGLEHVWCCGALMRHAADACPGARWFEGVPALLEALPREAPAAASILVKGSRFIAMERVVQALQGVPRAEGTGAP
jgi:UDP-N-acetylmuramoyl-tripeptide--D-alanyl-D-alanine ligase